MTSETRGLGTPAPSSGRMPGSLLGMMLFLSSEVMFFASLFGAYFTIRGRAPSWPPPEAPDLALLRPALFSILLIASSVTMQFGVIAARRDDRRQLTRWLVLTLALGAVFLAGQAWEYAELANDGFTVSTDIFGTTFYAMTGFHGLHVAGGLLAIGLIASAARRQQYGARRIGPIEAVSYYWHFVDVIWILLFSTIYVLR
jgi:cytochrome c oxidase subunit III